MTDEARPEAAVIDPARHRAAASDPEQDPESAPSVDPLDSAAETLCGHHGISSRRPRPVPAWETLDAIPKWLDKARQAALRPPPEATKASEWLLDNEYTVRRAIRQLGADMSPKFYARLPALAAPEWLGAPRVLMIAHGFLEAAHMQVSLSATVRFLTAYQRGAPLTIAELWAFPAMLRLACLETIVIAFSELSPDLAPPFGRAPGAVYGESHDPTEAVSRAIMALAAVARIPWREAFEQTSRVEAILRDDPVRIYSAMEFETRDTYRKAVEALARGSGCSEPDIALRAVALAGNHAGATRAAHVGWWLVGGGRTELERLTGFRLRPIAAARHALLAHAGATYALGLAGFGAVAMAVPIALLMGSGDTVLGWVLGLLLSLMPASILAVTMVNWLVTLVVPPRVLPKLDFRDGLPQGQQAVLVLPVILWSEAEVAPVLEKIERHWLTHPDRRLVFAILSDLADAPQETMPGDADIETALAAGIRRLNQRYAPKGRFVLMHRRRRWNPADRIWMGWERKRGKLEEFNEFLHGGAGDAFPVTEGDPGALREASFVVTLDADTIAPPGTIHRLIGTLAHPLNRVEFDPEGVRAIDGYTFIQPRIEISPEAGSASLFTRLFTGDTAIDIYSRAVSNVYQDLFGEGIFTGKGAYDAAAFRQSLYGRVPENALVSHDLFEGLHGRAALASDIVFYEDFPARYPDYALRLHRWVRGDWQLLPWLMPRVPGRGGASLDNPLSALDRWKIIDNLRRSLVAPGLVFLALSGWLIAPHQAFLWSLLTVATPGAYLITDLVGGFARGRRRGAVVERRRQLLDHAGRWALAAVFMAHEAIIALDAISRALWRMAVSRKHMLEWTSAAHVAAASVRGRPSVWRAMAGAPILAAAMATELAFLDPEALPGAAPLLVLWFVSPEIARLIARPRRVPAEERLAAEDRRFLRRLARRTWLYFETFAGPEDNWLPPDNYQTEPHEEIAHRSSPTNVGMLFLSALSALDFGHIGPRDLAARSAAALAALARIERYRGHVLNWFDTRSLHPLEPRYVSTVDSGNLAVALVTLAEGCCEAADGPAIGAAQWEGLADTLGLLRDSLTALPEARARALLVRLDQLTDEAARARDRPQDWAATVRALHETSLPGLAEALPEALDAAPAQDPSEIRLWLERSTHHVASLARDLDALCPWAEILGAPPPGQEALAIRLAALLPPDLALGASGAAVASARAVLREASSEKWHDSIAAALDRGLAARTELRKSFSSTASHARALAEAMDFSFLYDSETRTFFIGYNLGVDRMDQHRYDLLASEARLASYFAIAKGDVPAEHWFHLGRPLAHPGRDLTILSWNGSMFEYLMPALVMRSGRQRLLGQSEAAAVAVQKRYGDRMGLPWGVSEAAFATRDAAHRYQYRAFGVPGLGLKRGLEEDYVVAPYASALALAVVPAAATANLRRLDALGLQSRYGFYDAADFSAERSPGAGRCTPVQTFMAHHQGMALAAIDNVLNGDILVHRFNREPRIAALEMLLQERVPWEYVPEPLPETGPAPLPELERRPPPILEGWSVAETGAPQLHLVGNGRLSAWITAGGESTLWWHGQSLTRWSGDLARPAANRLILRDASDGTTWDFAPAPDRAVDITFHPARATFHLNHHGIAATQDIAVAEADDVEIRRVTLVNDSDTAREIEVSSYAEVVLAPSAAHERHPAFSKLFVRSEPLVAREGLMFSRRPRRPADRPPVMLQRLVDEIGAVRFAGFDSDRREILGRGNGEGLASWLGRAPKETAGWTLDPAAALRARVRLGPRERAEFAFLSVAAGSRETAVEIADRYASASALDWAFDDAARTVALEADRLGASGGELREAQALAAELVRPPVKRAEALGDVLAAQPDLWGLGISGDLPIFLVEVPDPDNASLLPAALKAHHWWRRRGLGVDLVVLATGASSYEATISSSLRDALREAGLDEGLGGNGGVHLHSADRIGALQRRALRQLAHAICDGTAETLTDGLVRVEAPRTKPPLFQPGGSPHVEPAESPARLTDLAFDNGIGGFTPDGESYVIQLAEGQKTPVPWCNVLANAEFGTIVSESGLGFTWSLNSGEHRLTPWSNDPVTDAQGEALYLRDEETAEIWTPTPLPAGGGVACRVDHRPGLSEWLRTSHGLEQRLAVAVPDAAPVKLVHLRLQNLTDRPRRVTATYVAEWQLGALPSVARPRIVCGYHTEAGALIARSGWQPAFAARIAFLAASRHAHSLTCDRAAFFGENGDAARPEGLCRWTLDGEVGAARDPCAAFQVHLDIAPHASEEVVFVLGDAADLDEMVQLVSEWSDPARATAAIRRAGALWDRRLDAVHVTTSDPALDLMVNRWLPYQAMASRIFARAGFSQAGGGIGFRDQLQDMMAFLIADPARVRRHILACAAHQFEEGDVMHWWHEPEGRGVRTRCSDDMLWLVHATHRYVRATGDRTILDEEVPFLTAPPLSPDEDDRYAAFEFGPEAAPLFEHCLRALTRGVTSGPHGLPLIGAGDWNDGMDRVGPQGRGESLWLAWFAADCATGFADLAEGDGHAELAEHWRHRAAALKTSADRAGWDGQWYVRAFDDHGQPWGSKASDECRIDCIAQSWAVLAGAPDPAHAAQAIAAAEQHLVDPEMRLVRLLTPPFDRTPRDPGYIRAYPPGVRENGGQYTHAATWLGLALARLGDGDGAWRIFDLINPIRRSADPAARERYRGEPYVMPADVGGAPPYEGRAGWTWYTGAAAWSWRLAVEGILGLELVDGALVIAPCLPKDWGGYSATIRGPAGMIELTVEDPGAVGSGPVSLVVNGRPQSGARIDFPMDGTTARVTARLNATAAQGIATKEGRNS